MDGGRGAPAGGDLGRRGAETSTPAAGASMAFDRALPATSTGSNFFAAAQDARGLADVSVSVADWGSSGESERPPGGNQAPGILQWGGVASPRASYPPAGGHTNRRSSFPPWGGTDGPRINLAQKGGTENLVMSSPRQGGADNLRWAFQQKGGFDSPRSFGSPRGMSDSLESGLFQRGATDVSQSGYSQWAGDSQGLGFTGPTLRISVSDKDGKQGSPGSRGRSQPFGRVGMHEDDLGRSSHNHDSPKDRSNSKFSNPFRRVRFCTQILMGIICILAFIPFVYRMPVARHGLGIPTTDRRFAYGTGGSFPGSEARVSVEPLPGDVSSPPGESRFGPGVIDAENVRAAVRGSDERARAGLVHQVQNAKVESVQSTGTSELDDVAPGNGTNGLWGNIFAGSTQEEFDCDRSSPLTDVCTIRGDVRINVTSGEIVLYARNPQTPRGQRFIRPHPRKWNGDLMERSVTQFTIQSVDYNDPTAPVMECARRNSAPGVLFSVGGFCGGVFHDFNEVYLPLFETTHAMARDVVFLVADLKGDWWWHDAPRRSFVGAMTRHAIRLIGRSVDTESYAQGVECFDHLTLGLYQNLCMYDEFGGRESRAYAQSDVRDFAPYIRAGLQMSEPAASRVFVPAGTIPVVGLVQRMNTRKLVNYDALLRVAEKEGYKVVPVTFEDLSPEQAAETMTPLDVLVGVHGAGLSNICLMRPGGVVLQIMPYGEGGARNSVGLEYKNFAAAMGAEYLEWSVPVHDSTIKDQYNHTDWIVTSPLMIWKTRGQDAMNIYHRQDVVMPEDMLAAYLRQIKRTLNLKARLAQELESQAQP